MYELAFKHFAVSINVVFIASVLVFMSLLCLLFSIAMQGSCLGQDTWPTSFLFPPAETGTVLLLGNGKEGR